MKLRLAKDFTYIEAHESQHIYTHIQYTFYPPQRTISTFFRKKKENI